MTKQINEGYQPKPNQGEKGYQPVSGKKVTPHTPPPGFGSSIQSPAPEKPASKK